MTESLLQLIGGVMAALVGGTVAVIVARTNTAASKTVAILPPYDALARRVATLEADAERAAARLAQQDADNAKALQMLKDKLIEYAEDRDQLVAYITEWFRWYHAGRMPPPPPVPMHLRDQLVWKEEES